MADTKCPACGFRIKDKPVAKKAATKKTTKKK